MAEKAEVKPHVHKYMMVKWGKTGTIVYRCMVLNCPHYLDRRLVKGKLTVCWECGARTVMEDENLRRAKPKCFGACSGKRDEISEAPITEKAPILEEELGQSASDDLLDLINRRT